MTPEAALYQFMGSFGVPAFPASSVPDQTAREYPYLTYDLTVGTWEGGEVNVPARLWYRTESEALPNSKVREITRLVGPGGIQLPCDGGTLWVKRGEPWAQSTVDEGDTAVKGRYINFDIEFLVVE